MNITLSRMRTSAPLVTIALLLLAITRLNAPAAQAEAAPTPTPGFVTIIQTSVATPTAQPTATAEPTLPPTDVPTLEPQVVYVEKEVVIEVTPVLTEVPPSPPEPTLEVKPAQVGEQLPSGTIILLDPTPGPGDPGFAESFAEPTKQATCAFTGCLPGR